MLLAVERSSATGSASLYSKDNKHINTIYAPLNGHGDAYSLIKTVFDGTDVSIADVTRFAVSLGPGSFSGIRSAIAVLNGLAMPIGAKVMGVGSAVASAYVYRRDNPRAERIAVVGDARRGRMWLATFGAGYSHCHDGRGFAQIPKAEIADAIPQDAIVITPDWARIGADLSIVIPKNRLVTEPIYPDSKAIAELAIGGYIAEVTAPVYINPPVMGPAK